MKKESPRFKRKQFYVLPKFQNRFMLVMTFQVLLIFGGVIVPQYRILSSYIEKIESSKPIEAPAQPSIGLYNDADASGGRDVRDLILIRNSLLTYSTIFILATSLIFGFYCSHRLGGPVYKTIMYLRNFREGKTTAELSFRTGDFFHELAVEVNEVLKHKCPQSFPKEKAEDRVEGLKSEI